MHLKAVRVKAPTRVDLCGGTLDLWPIWAMLPESITINLAIDIFTYADIEEHAHDYIEVSAPGIQVHKIINNIEDYISDRTNMSDFFYPHIKFFKPTKCKLTFGSDSPIGGGLGGSSSLTISLITALSHYTKKDLGGPQSIVELAHNIEAFLLKTPTGVQDYYPPLLGGSLCLHHKWSGLEIESLDFGFDYIKEHFLLVYTGSPHHSGMNNWSVLKANIDGEPATKTNLMELRDLANVIYEDIKRGRWENMARNFEQEYALRSALSPAFTSKGIRELSRTAKAAGADTIKICGAGGGGCVFVWVKPAFRQDVVQALKNTDFKVLDASPIKAGVQVRVE